jgi:uncharacterized membrane protein YdbT with pleckstrin-like domain
VSYIQRNLLPTERIIYSSELHWFEYIAKVVLSSSLAGLVCFPFLLALSREQNLSLVLFVISVMAIFNLFGFLIAWINISTSEFAVTNTRVLVKVGLIRRNTFEVFLRQVEGVGVDQGILGRILDFGTIIVSGTGATREKFMRIRRPLEFRRQVHVQVQALAGISGAGMRAGINRAP